MRMIVIASLSAALVAPATAREVNHYHAHAIKRHSADYHVARHHVRYASRHAYRARYVRLGYDPYATGWESSQPAYRSMDMTPAWSNDDGWYGRSNRRNAGYGPALDGIIARHAAANGVPLELARRVVARESGGNPRAVSRGNYGLMQIRQGTARAMGYSGSASGLLDPETNLTYAMRYLAGAYRAAGGNHNRAVALYARGYYYEAKRQGWSPYEGSGYGSYASARSPQDETYGANAAWHQPRRHFERQQQGAWAESTPGDWWQGPDMQATPARIARPVHRRSRR